MNEWKEYEKGLTEEGPDKEEREKAEAASKKKLVDALQSLLGLPTVHFEKLSKQELKSLLGVISNLSHLGQIGVKTLKTRVANKINTNLLDRNLREIIHDKTLFSEEGGGLLGLGLLSREDGPLGLGIIPGLRQRITGEKEHE